MIGRGRKSAQDAIQANAVLGGLFECWIATPAAVLRQSIHSNRSGLTPQASWNRRWRLHPIQECLDQEVHLSNRQVLVFQIRPEAGRWAVLRCFYFRHEHCALPI